MNRTIFISSTYIDLKEHRRRIWDLTESFQVNVRGMEKFGARKEAPLETCLNEVMQSEVFIGIISNRLGTIDDKSGLSYVQCEYEKAKELGLDILIYLIDENDGLINPRFVDHGESYDKLIEFTKKLKENHTIDTFKDPKDLADKLLIKFEEIFERKDMSLKVRLGDYDYSSKVLGQFQLLPSVYTGTQLNVKIKVASDAFAVSSEICEAFSYKFGATIGYEFGFVEPIAPNDFLDVILVPYKVDVGHKDQILNKGDIINAVVKLKFTLKDIKVKKARFGIEAHNPLTMPYLMTANQFQIMHSGTGFIALELENIYSRG